MVDDVCSDSDDDDKASLSGSDAVEFDLTHHADHGGDAAGFFVRLVRITLAFSGALYVSPSAQMFAFTNSRSAA